jgi:hypothetical protein
VAGHGIPAREKGQTVRKRGGIDADMTSRTAGEGGVNVLNVVVWDPKAVGVAGALTGALCRELAGY